MPFAPCGARRMDGSCAELERMVSLAVPKVLEIHVCSPSVLNLIVEPRHQHFEELRRLTG
jgi:hypothetical protein